MRSGVSPESTSTSSTPSSEAPRTTHGVSGSEAPPAPRPRLVEGIGRRRRCNDDDGLRTELVSDLEHPVDHPLPEQRVEVLRGPGAHTRPETGGHHDGAEARLRSGHRGWAPGFEPGITGPKPVALPLGHAPEHGHLAIRCRTGWTTHVRPASPRVEAARSAAFDRRTARRRPARLR